MYNLNVEEISMVDGGGDGNSSSYPASPRAIRQMSGPQGDWGRGVLCGMAVSAAGAAVASLSAGTSAAAAAAAGASFGGAVCGRN
ncbi:hypothetical protein [Vibrio tasmaniensis]|uniref:hypothetical protein n=1 Tax=Vibrio tasmaniensis TaxID=212663 RepID=UPI0011199631|nr:hypothetical protein [Vibrio tasmaniensis]